MKWSTWRKHHKWIGIIFCFFMMMFCLSGIVLNHRSAVSDLNVSRGWLPGRYHYTAWNGGLLRGTTSFTDKDSVISVLVYGKTGGYGKRTARLLLSPILTTGCPQARITDK